MEETNFASMMIQSIGALALVLAIFAALEWAMRRMQDGMIPQKEGKMRVVQRMHLDSRNSIVEIRHGDKHFLIGVGQGGVQKISEFISVEVTEHVQNEEVTHQDA